MWDGRRRRDESLAMLETGLCHRQAELGLSQVACQPIDCCNGAAGVTSCWHQRARETECKVKCRLEVGTSVGMKGTAGDGVGKVGSALAHHAVSSHPAASLPAKQWAQERSRGFLFTLKAASPGLSYPAVSLCPCPREPWTPCSVKGQGRGSGKGCVWRLFLSLC